MHFSSEQIKDVTQSLPLLRSSHTRVQSMYQEAAFITND